jgi:hypothetical protein
VISLQTIMLHEYVNLTTQVKLPLRVIKALEAIMGCRTAAMGGRHEYCPDGHHERILFNSCQHRFCPRCGYIAAARWLEKVKAMLLACPHHHVTFTLPPQLHALWEYNRKVMMDIFFRVVRDTLFDLLGDPKYGAILPGMICSLHTWGRSLPLHPHIHCLITAGGLVGGLLWVYARKKTLLPYEVVKRVYRGKMIGAIREGLEKGQLVLPAGVSRENMESTLNKLSQKKWNVEISERYAHGNGVIEYLSRYIRGTPIHNHQIQSYDSRTVSFQYKDHRDNQEKVMTLPAVDFLRRLLQHVPPAKKKTVRYFGLYAESNRALLNISRAAMGQEDYKAPDPPTWETLWRGKPEEKPNLCPICHRPLILGRRIPKWECLHPGVMSPGQEAA